MKNIQKGFSLIELLVVIAVIGILLGIGITSFANSQNRAKKEQAVAVAEKVKLALGSYYSEKDRYPRNQSTVVSYLNSKNQASTATEFGATATYVYTGTAAGGGTCSDTGADKCEKYTITIQKNAWNGGSSDTNVVVGP